jgi:hypothetical protein
MLEAMSRIAALVLALSATASAGTAVWPSSKSPDGKLGVTVPDRDHVQDGQHQNALVEIASGKQLVVIDADNAGDGMQLDFAPQWSRDGSVLVWLVDGKWGSWACAVVHVDRGAVAWQVDVRGKAVARALADARAAQPKLYAAVATHGKDSGAWFRDGFAVDVRPELPASGAVALPLKIAITMTSDPKDIDAPDLPRYDAHGSATLGVDGKLTFGKLVVDKARP